MVRYAFGFGDRTTACGARFGGEYSAGYSRVPSAFGAAARRSLFHIVKEPKPASPRKLTLSVFNPLYPCDRPVDGIGSRLMCRLTPIRILSLLGIIGVAIMVYFNPTVRSIFGVYRQKRALATAADVNQVALACLELLKSGQSGYIPRDDPRIPPVIRFKKPMAVFIDPPAKVMIEFGGGFEHYGYRLEPASPELKNWKLLFYGEEPDDIHEILRF
ncbi:MAG TPA: hypothetical protein VGM54_05745 [Chthoniobacter sp.]|jgi:hypothetical protein